MKLNAYITAAVILSLFSQPGWSGDRGKGGKHGRNGAGDGVSERQAAAIARRKTGGRVLSVQENDGGYRVKVLTGSHEVRSVKVPGRRR